MHEPLPRRIQVLEDPAQDLIGVVREVVVSAHGHAVPPAGLDAFGGAEQGVARGGDRVWHRQQPKRAQACACADRRRCCPPRGHPRGGVAAGACGGWLRGGHGISPGGLGTVIVAKIQALHTVLAQPSLQAGEQQGGVLAGLGGISEQVPAARVGGDRAFRAEGDRVRPRRTARARPGVRARSGRSAPRRGSGARARTRARWVRASRGRSAGGSDRSPRGAHRARRQGWRTGGARRRAGPRHEAPARAGRGCGGNAAGPRTRGVDRRVRRAPVQASGLPFGRHGGRARRTAGGEARPGCAGRVRRAAPAWRRRRRLLRAGARAAADRARCASPVGLGCGSSAAGRRVGLQSVGSRGWKGARGRGVDGWVTRGRDERGVEQGRGVGGGGGGGGGWRRRGGRREG